MKFFVELVSCCGCSSKRAHRPAAEEEEILVPVAAVASSNSNNIISYKRKRDLARSGGSLPEWKPSLSSISEDIDHSLSPRMQNKVTTTTSRSVKLHRHRKPRFSRIASLAAMVPAPFMM
ncbi:unnamed protein product [Withania somnifera]